MGQVPKSPKYLIVGSGRLARHLHFYFQSLEVPHWQWARKPLREFNTLNIDDFPYAGDRLTHSLEQVDHVLLAISDQALVSWASQQHFGEKVVVHFSGSLTLPNMVTLHPLMTFGPELYEKELYPQIPFVYVSESTSFDQVFPELPNPSFPLEEKNFALYHALCVISGNFPTVLAQACFQEFEKYLGLPREVLFPFLRVTMNNILTYSESALTGPLARGDKQTIDKNLQALSGNPLSDIYESFLKFYKTTRPQ
ncbi:MAG: DUF2520 domain-containing protein [Pseudobdellovibrionaceae bacterium]|nr:DUF2520 domain-containing protein [Bdellovibrionales bacterium]USN47136.1 MAG: DUF2520 domain-containing protein [Pseudobdellovibrionaceae bacterium]